MRQPRRRSTQCARHSLIALGAAAALVDRGRRRRRVHGDRHQRAPPRRSDHDDGDECEDPHVHGRDGKAFTITDGRYTGARPTSRPRRRPRRPAHVPRARRPSARRVAPRLRRGLVQGQGRRHRFARPLLGHARRAGKFAGFLTADAARHNAKVLGTPERHVRRPAPASRAGRARLGSSASAALAVIAGPVCKKAPKREAERRRAPHNTGSTSTARSRRSAARPSSSPSLGKGPTTAMCAVDGSSPSTAGFALEQARSR